MKTQRSQKVRLKKEAAAILSAFISRSLWFPSLELSRNCVLKKSPMTNKKQTKKKNIITDLLTQRLLVFNLSYSSDIGSLFLSAYLVLSSIARAYGFNYHGGQKRTVLLLVRTFLPASPLHLNTPEWP